MIDPVHRVPRISYRGHEVPAACIGCEQVTPTATALFDAVGELTAFVCPACTARRDADAVFAWQVDACLAGGYTRPEIDAVIAKYGIDFPTTVREFRRARDIVVAKARGE
jgi:hypothetical protein